MADVTIRMKVEGQDAVNQIKKVGLSLTDIKSGLDLAKQAASTFTGVFEQAFEIGKEGGAIIQTRKSFEGLIDKLGLSKNLLNQLSTASAGTIDDMKLMSATSTLLAGTSGDLAVALGNSTPKLLEIAKAANKLNPSLGDTAFLYESIATGVKRASPMILDNLGLTIKIGKANEDYAKQLGKTVEQLTADEQKQALLNATLEAGNVLIEQAGGAAGSATDSFARLETTIANTGNIIKSTLSPALADAVDGVNLMLTRNTQLNDLVFQHSQELMKAGTSYEEYTREIVRASLAAYGHDSSVEAVNRRLVELGPNLSASMEGFGFYSEAAFAAAQEQEKMNKALEDAAPAFAANLQQVKDAPPRFDDYSMSMDDMKKSQEEFRLELEKTDLSNLLDDMKSYSKELLFQQASAGLDADAQRQLAASLGLIDEKTSFALDAADKLKQRFLDGELTASQYARAIQDINSAINGLHDKSVTINIDTIQSTNRRFGGEAYASGGSFYHPGQLWI